MSRVSPLLAASSFGPQQRWARRMESRSDQGTRLGSRPSLSLRAIVLAVIPAIGCQQASEPAAPTAEPTAPLADVAVPAETETSAQTSDASPACTSSSFESTPTGVAWRIGDRTVEFTSTVEFSESASEYNYRRRTVHLVHDGIDLHASCYPETDCDVPDDAEGHDRWCLVSHGLRREHLLRSLFEGSTPCESSLELLEGLAQHSAAPTCFRAALPTYPGAPWEKLAELSEPLQEEGVPAATLAELERLAKAANDADRGYNDPVDNAAVAKALRELDALLVEHAHHEAAWELRLVVARSLARVEARYPATLVGPKEVLYDAWFGAGEEPPKITRTAAPWDGP